MSAVFIVVFAIKSRNLAGIGVWKATKSLFASAASENTIRISQCEYFL